jgi:uncharacterized membrane protein YkoI
MTARFIPGSCAGTIMVAMRTHLTAIAIAAALLCAAQPAPAEQDHDRARRAVLAGEALPLSPILERAQAEFGGQFLEAELEENHHGRLVYEIKLLTAEGRVLKLLYDARDGHLIKAKGRGVER